MPRMIEDTIISNNARNKLCSASGIIVAGNRVPIPVRVTVPMIIPTQAAATTRGTTPRAALINPRTVVVSFKRVLS